MSNSHRVAILTGLGVLSSVGMTRAQDLNAYVTVVTSAGVHRITESSDLDRHEPFQTGYGSFGVSENGLYFSEGVKTPSDGTAVIVVRHQNLTIHVLPDSELLIDSAPRMDGVVPLVIRLRRGQASVIRKRAGEGWLATVVDSVDGSGHLMSRNGSVHLCADGTRPNFEMTHETGWYVAGPLPQGPWLDASGNLANPGTLLTAGNAISIKDTAVAQTGEPTTDGIRRLSADLLAFGRNHCRDQVEQTERGDIIPVREVDTAPEQALGRVVFDDLSTDNVPRFTLLQAVRTPRRLAQQLRADPSRALLRSGIPSQAVVGGRFIRSRIVGSSLNGRLFSVNPFLRPPIRLR